MIVDGLDAQINESFSQQMSYHNTKLVTLPARSTSFSQPVDRNFGVRIKKLVKKRFRELLEEQHAKFEAGKLVKKLTVSDLRLRISTWVSDAWSEVIQDTEFMANTFKNTGLSLPIDGSQDDKIQIPGVGKIVVQ